MKDLTTRACQLAGRGVRRVFAIRVRSRKQGGEDVLVKAGPVLAWMPGHDRWTQEHWEELWVPAQPIRVRALLDAPRPTTPWLARS